jgi:hypothetical protein
MNLYKLFSTFIWKRIMQVIYVCREIAKGKINVIVYFIWQKLGEEANIHKITADPVILVHVRIVMFVICIRSLFGFAYPLRFKECNIHCIYFAFNVNCKQKELKYSTFIYFYSGTLSDGNRGQESSYRQRARSQSIVFLTDIIRTTKNIKPENQCNWADFMTRQSKVLSSLWAWNFRHMK